MTRAIFEASCEYLFQNKKVLEKNEQKVRGKGSEYSTIEKEKLKKGDTHFGHGNNHGVPATQSPRNIECVQEMC